jgi:hypothetical protein
LLGSPEPRRADEISWLIRRVAMLRVHSRDARHDTGTEEADTLMSGWACA